MPLWVLLAGIVLWMSSLAVFSVCNIIVVSHAMRKGYKSRGEVWRFARSDEFQHPHRRLVVTGLFGGMTMLLLLSALALLSIVVMKAFR